MTNINSYTNSYSNYNKSISSTSNNAVTEKDLETQLKEFEEFKAQNYKEVEAIFNSSSSKFKSGSIEVTAGALLRMQSDPAFKDEMMRLLQEDADATHSWTKSGESHIKIDENGYTGHSKSFLGDELAEEQANSNTSFMNKLFNNNSTNTEETLDKNQYKQNQNQSLIKKMSDALNENREIEKDKAKKLEKEKQEEKLQEKRKASVED